MRIILRSCVPFLLVLFTWPALQAPGATTSTLVLTHVTVIDTTGGPVQADTTIVIRGERIAAMGKSGEIRVPPGSQVVNAKGKFLIPGLWDMDVLWYEPDYLPLFIANGVTGVRETIGYAEQYEWRKRVETGRLLGPRMVIASRWIEGPEPPDLWTVSVSNASEARQAVLSAKKYGADYVRLGGGETLPRDAFFALADEAKKQRIPFEGAVPVSVTIAEASNAGMKSIEEQPSMFGIEMILSACSNREADLLKSWRSLSISTEAWETFWEGPQYRAPLQLALDTYNPERAKALFGVLRANHTWVIPTLTGRRNTTFLDDPAISNDRRLQYMSAAERSWWASTRQDYIRGTGPEGIALKKRAYQRELELVGAMRRAGVDFLAGTTTEDPLFAVAGFSLHDEMALLVQAGFSPLEALQAATLNPARYLGRERDLGTVAPGKFADLVLLDANPLQDINNTRKIEAVVYRGKFYDRSALGAMLAKIQKLASQKYIRDVLETTIKEKGAEAAVRQYRQIKSAQPDAYNYGNSYEEGLTSLADKLADAKKFNEAIQILDLKIEESPTSWWAYDRLGDAYMETGEKALAIKSFRKSLQLDPAQAYATFQLNKLNKLNSQ